MLVKPKKVSVMQLDCGDWVYIALHPNQYWEVTFFVDNKKKVGLVRGNLSLIVNMELFKEKFELLEHKSIWSSLSEESQKNSGEYDLETMYIVKENTAKKLGCKHYIHCEMNDLYLFYISGQGFKPILGNGGGEYVITLDNCLIDVTGNSLSAIEKEVCLGTAAYGYIGIVEDMWHTNSFEKLFSETDLEPKRITVFDLLRNITSVKSFTSQIFSLMQGINSEEELLEKIAREFSKEQAAAIIATAKKGYPLSFEGLQK